MAHFAKISEENIVLNVVRVSDGHAQDEAMGQTHLERSSDWPAHLWIQTSYNTKNNKHESGDDSKAFRGNYAGVGYTWDSENQIFLPPKDHASWVLNLAEARWQSPVGDAPELTAEQESTKSYYDWDEANQSWILKTIGGETDLPPYDEE
jgi:hypothetical protein